MTGGIILPEFDPFVINFGGFGIRWYALAYIAGLLGGYWILRREATRPWRANAAGSHRQPSQPCHHRRHTRRAARLCRLLQSGFFRRQPIEILMVWQGGMSFHGGLAGVALAMWIFARKRGIPVLAVSDRVAMVTPIGLFLGRLSNFINAELYGRVTSLPWGMVFPGSDGQPRHPSQLYEAGLEGLVLGAVMLLGWRRGWLGDAGSMTATLLIGYGLSRFVVEYVRQPDPQTRHPDGPRDHGPAPVPADDGGRRLHHPGTGAANDGTAENGSRMPFGPALPRPAPSDVEDYMAICLGDQRSGYYATRDPFGGEWRLHHRAGNLGPVRRDVRPLSRPYV